MTEKKEEESIMISVNGRTYTMWGQFVKKKKNWIGGILEDDGDSMDRRMGAKTMQTTIEDIVLRPNGKESAFFEIVGKDFSCGFDVSVGGIGSPSGRGADNSLEFSGYGGHTFRISKP